jgi:6-phosphogluconolactonase (cycloisomerase 2 family)
MFPYERKKGRPHLVYRKIPIFGGGFELQSLNERKTIKVSCVMENFLFLLIGTMTSGLSDGIYLYKFDVTNGDTQYVSEVAIENPSYLDVGDGKYIYALTQSPGDDAGSANVLLFDREQEKLSLVNRQETFASGPCYIVADSLRKFVATANYSGSSITVFKTQADTLLPASQLIIYEGSSIVKGNQAMPHPHCVYLTPDGKYLLVTDLGTDHIYRYEINAADAELPLNEKTMKAFKTTPGAGPRLLTFHPSNKYMYVVNELSRTVTGFHYNDGELLEFQTIPTDSLSQAKGAAHIEITPNGKFLYASNRLMADGIAIFSINEADGMLTKIGYQPTGRHPRNFVIAPNGKYLLSAAMNGSLIEVFEIDESTGLLKNIGKDITAIDMPVCLKFLP